MQTQATLSKHGLVQPTGRPRTALTFWLSTAGLSAMCLLTSISVAQTRIVSTNVCSDELVLSLARPDSILSLSYISHDPNSSSLAARARRYPANRGGAEEILKLKPSLVFMSSYSSPYTKLILSKSGIRTVRLPLSHSIKDMHQNIQRVAQALGTPTKGRQLQLRLRAQIKQILAPLSTFNTKRPTVLTYSAGGWQQRPPSLLNELITLAGGDNLAKRFAGKRWTYINAEAIVRLKPDYLVVIQSSQQGQSLTQQFLQHPVFDYYRQQSKLIVIKNHWIDCGNPVLIHALRTLAHRLHPTHYPRQP